MYQTDQSTAASSLPTPAAAGTQGYFTNGNPASGVAPTIVDADWLNMIQQELVNVVLAAGGTPSKTTYTQVRDSIKTMYGPGRLLNVQEFTSSGTYTPTPGTNSIIVEVQAAGGGSGGCAAQGSTSCALSVAGTGGTYVKARITSVPSTAAVTIGAAGAAGSSTVAGGAGGTSSLIGTGVNVSCPGGPGGTFGGGSSNTAMTVVAGIAGPTTAPTLTGATAISTMYGSASKWSVSGNNFGAGGYGGDSFLGRGGAGGTGNSGAANGNSGTGYGAGAGAAFAAASGTAATGAAGTQGIVIIHEYA